MPFRTRRPRARRPRRRAMRRRGRLNTKAGMQNRNVRIFTFKTFDEVTNSSGTTADRMFFTRGTADIIQVPQFTGFVQFYEEYKVLGFSVKFYPFEIGGEAPGVSRGNQITWTDINGGATEPAQGIAAVMNKSSVKIINPRRNQLRWINRPSGFPDWTVVDSPLNNEDRWKGQVILYGDQTAPAAQQFWSAQTTYRIAVRGRNDNQPNG